MSHTLYRKYRPKSFAELTGQDHIKQTLLNQIESGKIAHAYLFTGPRGVGKTTTARLFAAAINKLNDKDLGEEIIAGKDIDVIEMDAASQTGIDNVRENIIENSRFLPHRRKYKVFIIDEVHMLSDSAFNALLKIIEEPPAHAIFVLATTELHEVPATIISRCQRYDFRKVPLKEIIEKLEKICQAEGVKVDDAVLERVARLADGGLRDAESLLGQIISLGGKKISVEQAAIILPASYLDSALQLLTQVIANNSQEALSLINQLADQGTDLEFFTADFLELGRALLLTKVSQGISPILGNYTKETAEKIIDLAKQADLPMIIQIMETFAAKKHQIKSSILPQLPLEIAVISCSLEKESFKTDPEQSRGLKKKSPPDGRAGEIKQNDLIQPIQSVKTEVSKSDVSLENQTNDRISDNSSTEFNLEIVRSRWMDLLAFLQNSNASLVLILKTSEPLQINGNKLTIGYKYSFS